jgi:hypothetical protein
MPFPVSIEKGVDLGSVDPVMIGADIYGSAQRASKGRLDVDQRRRLEQARIDLAASLPAIPEDALDYYELLIRIADRALQACELEPPTRLLTLPILGRATARVDCNGEVMWHRQQVEEALGSLVTVGADLADRGCTGGR